MKTRVVFALLFLVGVWCAPASAQFKDGGETSGVKLGKSEVQQWQFGLEVTATDGPCSSAVGYVALPTEWPEQQVSVVKEDISPTAKVTYETGDGGVRLMQIKMTSIPTGQTSRAVLTLEVHRSPQIAPEKTSGFKIPDQKKLDKTIKPYVQPSVLIESKSPKIKAALRGVGQDKETAWEKVEAIYDWTREKIKHQKGPTKGAVATLRDGTGNSECITRVFIAMCRAAGVPARTVWLPSHCYAEFYLVDESGEGYWFPCETHGDRSFGGIRELRPIIEKGDNFRSPSDRKKIVHVLRDEVTASGSLRPTMRAIRAPVKGQDAPPGER